MGNSTGKKTRQPEGKERCHILLLGIGGCGKTTCFNHLSLVHEKYEVTLHAEESIVENSLSGVYKTSSLLTRQTDVPEFQAYQTRYKVFQQTQLTSQEIFDVAASLSATYDLNGFFEKNMKHFHFNDEVGQ